MQSLLQKSEHLQQSAKIVVQKTGIVEQLQSIGQVEFVGSYPLDLMFRPDIDIFVIDKNCSIDHAVIMTKQLLDTHIFQTVGFANCHDYQLVEGLDGFYWELIYILDGVKWKFDIWYTATDDVKTIKNTAIIKERLKTNPTAKAAILELKDKYSDGQTYRDGMNGFQIYEQVLGKL